MASKEDGQAVRRAWLLAALAALSAMLLAALAVATNIATNMAPRWDWLEDPIIIWSLVAALAVVVSGLAFAQQRCTGPASAIPTPHEKRVFGAIPRRAWHLQPRERETLELREALTAPGEAGSVALSGARGSGKSQLAAAYAITCVDSGYDLVAWINAEIEPEADLAVLASRCGLGDLSESPVELARRVCSWLRGQQEGRFLLVFDNVDDPDVVATWLPHPGKVEVLVTTNRAEFATMSGFRVVPVGMFTPDEGQTFLHQATGLPAGADAAALGDQLGWLPLGLAQAGAYIAGNRLSYRQYLTELADQNMDETLRRRGGTDHPGVLRVTQLSMTGLLRSDPSGDAVRMLSVLSVLSADGISRRFLNGAGSALQLAGGIAHALDLLVSASLITLSGSSPDEQGSDDVSILVHRLTARVIRHQAAGPGAVVPLLDAVAAAAAMVDKLADGLTADQVAHRRSELDELVGHIRSVRQHVVEDPPQLLVARIRWAGQMLTMAGDVASAVSLMEQAVTDCSSVLGADHSDTMDTRSDLFHVYKSAGRLDKAITLCEQVLADRERVTGADGPDAWDTRSDLAHLYQSAGRLDEAIILCEQVLADRARTSGTDDLDTWIARSDLADAYQSAGRQREALALYEKVLADSVRVLGADHAHTLSFLIDLADAYLVADMEDEAIDLLEREAALDGRASSTDDLKTLGIYSRLARVHERANNVEFAISLYEQVLADRLRLLGADHLNTMTTRDSLAYAYLSAGRIGEAFSLYEQVLGDRQRLLGPHHPHTLASRSNVAYVYLSAGHPHEASTLFEQLLADCTQVLSSQHWLTTAVREHVASIRQQCGDDTSGGRSELESAT